ncbi:MAG TPA: hypothetical protein VM253_00410 [Candidatus Limnocylindrales bacterium]|jgi:hypothetical protein|nr:hypothetical protein [Candidatus Limnocylindrales bacterium]
MYRYLVILALGVILVVGALNVRIVGAECLEAFADRDENAIFASCDATEFRMAIREFEWKIQEPDDYLARHCADPALASTRLCGGS